MGRTGKRNALIMLKRCLTEGDMKLEEIRKLSDDQLKMKVAEIYGFQQIGEYRYTDYGWHKRAGEDAIQLTPIDGGLWLQKIPDYVNDLNAVREIFLSLSGQLQNTFISHLLDIVQPLYVTQHHVTRAIVGATARQWCEAFLIGIEK